MNAFSPTLLVVIYNSLVATTLRVAIASVGDRENVIFSPLEVPLRCRVRANGNTYISVGFFYSSRKEGYPYRLEFRISNRGLSSVALGSVTSLKDGCYIN